MTKTRTTPRTVMTGKTATEATAKSMPAAVAAAAAAAAAVAVTMTTMKILKSTATTTVTKIETTRTAMKTTKRKTTSDLDPQHQIPCRPAASVSWPRSSLQRQSWKSSIVSPPRSPSSPSHLPCYSSRRSLLPPPLTLARAPLLGYQPRPQLLQKQTQQQQQQQQQE